MNEYVYEQMVDQFEQLDIKTTVSELQQGYQYRVLKKGTHFVKQGEIEGEIAYIYKGLMRYYYITLDGDDVTKHFATENDFSTSYASFLYQKPTAYSIIAEEDCQLLVMNYPLFMEQILHDPRWERVARLYTEKIYNLKEIREASLLTMDAIDRYKAFRKAYPHIEKRLKQKHIATYLGIHPVTLSRIKKELKMLT